jgi:putative glycerol-1-phosphate prenyltransferase
MLKSVKDTSRCLLIAGGGIRDAEQARTSWEAGADIVVVGNGAANDHTILKSIHKVAKGLNKLVPQS